MVSYCCQDEKSVESEETVERRKQTHPSESGLAEQTGGAVEEIDHVGFEDGEWVLGVKTEEVGLESRAIGDVEELFGEEVNGSQRCSARGDRRSLTS